MAGHHVFGQSLCAHHMVGVALGPKVGISPWHSPGRRVSQEKEKRSVEAMARLGERLGDDGTAPKNLIPTNTLGIFLFFWVWNTIF